MTTSVIEASALCRVFASEDGREPVRAVDGVTFAVPPEARLVALIGPDGAGKSTLMQMICGLVGQDSGSLSVLGRTPDPDDEDFVNAVGYMPQTLGLYKDLSVMENMKLFGALRGAKPPEDMTIEAYYASLIALTGLEGFEGRPAGKLSGGMKQKLALAVALVRAPALLLLDEPTVGVDPLSRRELWAVIRRMVGQGGTTCFFSTAYLEEAESADWVLCMSEGRIIGSGTPAELLGRTKGRTYALDLSGFSDAERKSLSRRMMLKVSPAPEKSVFLDAVPRDGGIDLLLNAPNTREFAEREVELALRRDETGTVPDFDVLERAPRMEDAYALLTFTMETVRADDAASSAAPDPDDPGRLDTGDVPIRARDLSRTLSAERSSVCSAPTARARPRPSACSAFLRLRAERSRSWAGIFARPRPRCAPRSATSPRSSPSTTSSRSSRTCATSGEATASGVRGSPAASPRRCAATGFRPTGACLPSRCPWVRSAICRSPARFFTIRRSSFLTRRPRAPTSRPAAPSGAVSRSLRPQVRRSS